MRSRLLAESIMYEGETKNLSKEVKKELESLGFRELLDGSYMVNPSNRMNDVIVVEKDGSGLNVTWSVKGKHDYKEITVGEVGEFVKSIISKFGGSKVPTKIQEAAEEFNTIEIKFGEIATKEGLVEVVKNKRYTLYINGKSVVAQFGIKPNNFIEVDVEVKDPNYSVFNHLNATSVKIDRLAYVIKTLKEIGTAQTKLKELIENI